MRPISMSSPSPNLEELAALADQVNKNPKLLEQLSEQVYELFQENLRRQREQMEHYRRERDLV